MNTISKQCLDALIPKAIQVIKTGRFLRDEKISGTYHGYFSSFGADMVNTSPLAAVIFFEETTRRESDTATGSKEDKTLIPDAILRLLKTEDDTINDEKLSKYIISKSPNGITPSIVVEKIMAAAIALKIALRTFKKS